MLEKAGSKLFIAGEYAILFPNSYAIVAFIPKYTYLDISFSDFNKINTDIEDKELLIPKLISFTNKLLKNNNCYNLKYRSDLFFNNEKLGLGSSASLIVVTIKAILKINNINYDKEQLLNICIEFMKFNNIKGSYADIACIIYEDNIIFKSGDIPKIKIINANLNLNIYAIWTKKSASTKKLIKNIDIYNKEFINFKNTSNKLVLELIYYIDNNDIDLILSTILKLNENLRCLNNIFNSYIFNSVLDNIMSKYTYSKISGAGGGDFILSFEKSNDYNKFPNIKFIY